MAKKKRAGREPPPFDRRARLKMGAIGLAIMVPALALVIASAGYKWQLSEKRDRLRAEGQPVVATVEDFYSGSGRGSGSDRVRVSYTYEGRAYRTWIRCGGFTGCVQEPGPEFPIWVDPEDPDEFVAEDGNVTGSLFVLSGGTVIPAGLLFAAIGGVLLTVATVVGREKRQRSPCGRDGGTKRSSGRRGGRRVDSG